MMFVRLFNKQILYETNKNTGKYTIVIPLIEVVLIRTKFGPVSSYN
jgi:hypothetical protein